MNPLFDINQLNLIGRHELLGFECEYCFKPFYVEKHWVMCKLQAKNRRGDRLKYCSKECLAEARITKVKVNCAQCNKVFDKVPNQIKKSKSGNVFCSSSCAATYNNAHKTQGNRRSKLEIWLEAQLKIIYCELEILFNQKEAINSELDIYIPFLKLSFELNGIFHYEPIYGQDKLATIQNNDDRKFQACLEKKIELVIIDTSQLKNFKETKAIKYLNIIQTLIDNKMATLEGFEPT